MQTDSLLKTNSVKNTKLRDGTLQDSLLRDELMQELAQHKETLETFADDDANVSKASFENAVLANPALTTQTNTLRDCVEHTLRNYFAHLDGQPVTNIYDMVLSEVEAPLLEVVMRYTQNNQCRAAELLGLSRGTLRKKLQQHGML